MSTQFLLASQSPRRAELLKQMGYSFEQRGSDIDETALPEETGQQLVQRLAQSKAAVHANHDLPVLAADTVVVGQGRIMGKPEDREDALTMLMQLSNAWHEVRTAVCFCHQGRSAVVQTATSVLFGEISADAARAYWATGEPQDKAGSYAIQGLGGAFVREIRGSYSGVVGLPLSETLGLLSAAGMPPPRLGTV